MRIRWRTGATTVIGLWLSAAVASAQSPGNSITPSPPTAQPAGYVQAGLMLTGHGGGEQYHRAGPPLTGMPLGVAIGLGANVSSRVALEAELTFDGTLSAAQKDVYNSRTDYRAESQDILMGVNLRLRPRSGSSLEFTAGGGMAFSRFARRDIVVTSSFSVPPSVTRRPDAETSAWQPTLTGSMAIPLRLSSRVDVVPSLGVRWIQREFNTDAWYFGLGSTTILVGTALRMSP